MSKPEVIVKDKHFVIKIDSGTIRKRVSELAERLNEDYRGKKPIFVGVLTGAAVFAVDLFTKMDLDCELTFMRVSSYHSGITSSGEVKQVLGLKENIEGRHVVVIEDIVDTGITASYLVEELKKLKPASLKMATALFKPAALKTPVKPDYVGFEIDPEFVVGYGLDYDGYGRNLNDIYVLKP